STRPITRPARRSRSRCWRSGAMPASPAPPPPRSTPGRPGRRMWWARRSIQAISCPRRIRKRRRSCCGSFSWRADAVFTAWPRLEELLQHRRRLLLADRRIDLRHMMAGRRGEEAHTGLDRAALRIGRAIIEPADTRKGDRARAHRAGLERHVEIAVDQPLGADFFGGLPDRQYFGMRGRIALGQGAVARGGDDLVIAHNHASDRHLAGFSGVFRRFQCQIHERRSDHASYHREKPATSCGFSKSGYRFCDTSATADGALICRLTQRSEPPSCPATTTKTMPRAAPAIGRSATSVAQIGLDQVGPVQASLGQASAASARAAPPLMALRRSLPSAVLAAREAIRAGTNATGRARGMTESSVPSAAATITMGRAVMATGRAARGLIATNGGRAASKNAA